MKKKKPILKAQHAHGLSAGCGCGCNGEDMSCESEDMDDIEDPFEYLDALEDNYLEMAQIEARSSGMSLEEWLDTTAALYGMEGSDAGVKYVDMIDLQRQALEKGARRVRAAVTALEATVVSASKIPEDLTTRLRAVSVAVSDSMTLAARGRYEQAQDRLEDARDLISDIIVDDDFHNARDVENARRLRY